MFYLMYENNSLLNRIIEQQKSAYIFSTDNIIDNIKWIKENLLPWDNRLQLWYCIKTNPEQTIIKKCIDQWIDKFDCASIQEIKHLQSVYPDATILFNHPYTSQYDITQAISLWIKRFCVDSEEQLNKFPEWDGSKEIAVRITLSNSWTIEIGWKFGIHPDKAHTILDKIRKKWYKTSIAFHPWSQNTNTDIYDTYFYHIKKYINSYNINHINMWWWLPCNPFLSHTQNLNINSELCNKISNSIKSFFPKEHYPDLCISTEFWTGIVWTAVDILTSIICHKKYKGKTSLVINEWLYTSFLDNFLHNTCYNFLAFNKNRIVLWDKKMVRLRWRTCDPKDYIDNVELPDPDTHQYSHLLVKNWWAYTSSQASYFNWFTPHIYISI